MTTYGELICFSCSRLRPVPVDDGRIVGVVYGCDAFPEGIPKAFWEANPDHREPFPGDHGIRYEPGADADAAATLARWEANKVQAEAAAAEAVP